MQFGLLTFEDPKPDTSRKILHVDMDAFYASIEMRDHPEWANQPLVIARHPHETGGRGIVATCNYKAREYGIHSAMPALQAYQLCPHAIFVKGNMAYYRQVSQEIHQIFKRYTDLIEPLSLDEAYLDVTQNKVKEPSALKLAQQIQTAIKQETQLTASVGVSYNKFIAKIASDFHKPNGITLVTPQESQAFLLQLPLKDFHGVGKKTLAQFEAMGVRNGQDLYQLSYEDLVTHFGKMGHSLYYKVRGVYSSPVKPYRDRKSIGVERTFYSFLTQEEEVFNQLQALSGEIHRRLKAKDLLCQRVTLKIRYDDFQTLTRQASLAEVTNQESQILDRALDLWEAHGRLDQTIRLLGVSVSDLVDARRHSLTIKLID